VDEKERKHGNDPEKDADNQRFLEYMKRFVVHIFSSVCVVWVFFLRRRIFIHVSLNFTRAKLC